MAPFLVLIVAEGLGGLVRRAQDLGKFEPFTFGENQIKVSHLQFADDTIILGKVSFDNLRTWKAMFRSFELVSVLEVNFHKSSIIGINVQRGFLQVASEFLNCKPVFRFHIWAFRLVQI